MDVDAYVGKLFSTPSDTTHLCGGRYHNLVLFIYLSNAEHLKVASCHFGWNWVLRGLLGLNLLTTGAASQLVHATVNL